jgi:4-amino-4-deoxy-L-arabinose transferase-like glycosyltransferase
MLVLGGLAILALVVRVAFVMVDTRHGDDYLYDSFFYQNEARVLSEGWGFVDPGAILRLTPAHAPEAADHPPLTAAVLTPVAWLTGGDDVAMRLTFAVLGSVNVFLIGLLGLAVFGRFAAVAAAAFAAVYPFLWVNDGLIMSETLTVFLTVLALLLTYEVLRRHRRVDAVALGVICGLGALTRSELLLLPLGLALGVLLTRTGASRRARAALAAIVLVATGAVMTPWVLYNLSRFREPVLVSTSGELNLVGGSCDRSFYGPDTGLLGFCIPQRPIAGDQSQVGRVYRDRAITYTRRHLDRYPVVVLARMGRTWSLFRPWDMVKLNQSEGRPTSVTAAGLALYYPLLLFAIGGVVVLRRHRGVLWPLLVPVGIVTVTAFVSWGQIRYRVPAEPSLVVLGATALAALVKRGEPLVSGGRAEVDATA